MTTNEKVNPYPTRAGTSGPDVRLDPLTKDSWSPPPIRELACEISADGVSGLVATHRKGEGR